MEENTKNNLKLKKKDKIVSIFTKSLITKSIILPITSINKNIKNTINDNITILFEGKCLVEGYIKPGSINIITYSSGIVQGINILFEVVFECLICFPVEGTIILCTAKNITKAGIRAESFNEMPSPIIVFIAKDHHYNNEYFSTIEEGDKINVRVIGQRFELNDKYISIIGELIKPRIENNEQIKPRIIISD
jgi:DNA-directed RNA polymerase subunit E'/Rpb7